MRVFGHLTVAVAALATVQMISPRVLAQATAEASEADEGRIIQIGPDRGQQRRERRRERRADQAAVPQARVVAPKYWIGISGGPLSDELRSHVEAPADQGVLVTSVADGGPAAEAGLRRHDIILSANGAPIDSLGPLAEIVQQQGPLEGRIDLGLIRAGQPISLSVQPIERPAAAAPPARQLGGRLFGPGGLLAGEDLFGPGGLQLGEGLGEGMLEQFGGAIPAIAANGVSVSITRHGEGPARVTVRRGDQTWEFDEGDQDALNELPAEARGTVQRMLGAGVQGERLRFGAPGFQLELGGEGLAARLRAMEERMRALGGQLGGGAPNGAAPEAPLIEPEIELDEAPAFQPESGPIEIEIPSADEPEDDGK